MLWNQLLLRKKGRLFVVVFYDASAYGGVCSTSSTLLAVPGVLWHGFTQCTALALQSRRGIWAEWVCLREGAADRGSRSCRRMWAESLRPALLRQMRGNDGEMER